MSILAPSSALSMLLLGACFNPVGAVTGTGGTTQTGSTGAGASTNADASTSGAPTTTADSDAPSTTTGSSVDSCGWTHVALQTSPSPRVEHGLVRDGKRGLVLMFGGRGDPMEPDLGDLFVFNGKDWSQGAVEGPSGRKGHGMTLDAARDDVVVFGGAMTSPPELFADTWLYHGASTSWESKTAPSPAGREDAALAFHPGSGSSYLFGGQAKGVLNDELWSWDGATWAQIELQPKPAARSRHSLALDPSAGVLLLYGGCSTHDCDACDQDGQCFDDTWEFNGVAWTLAAQGGPRGQISAMAHDPSTDAMYRFAAGRSFRWSGTGWDDLQVASPHPHGGYAVTTHPSGDGIVLFGGLDDALKVSGETWVFRCDA